MGQRQADGALSHAFGIRACIALKTCVSFVAGRNYCRQTADIPYDMAAVDKVTHVLHASSVCACGYQIVYFDEPTSTL
jgi:hypothetical protein